MEFWRELISSATFAIARSSIREFCRSPTLLVPETNTEADIYATLNRPSSTLKHRRCARRRRLFDRSSRPDSDARRVPLIRDCARASACTFEFHRCARPASTCQGVCALHRPQSAWLHQPSNVLVTAEGRVRAARFRTVTTPQPASHTLAARRARRLMSPEQVGQKSVSEASDWYSVGRDALRSFDGTPLRRHVP